MTTESLPPRAAAHGRSLAVILAVIVVDMLGLGIIAPVLPQLIVELNGGSIAHAVVIAGWLALAYATMQFVFGPIIGSLSDRFGRRPVILAALGVYCLSYTLLGLATSLPWLVAARLVAGITGASFSVASAYIADVSLPEKRAQNFGPVGMAFGIGFVAGPIAGGLLGQIDTRLPFFVAAGFALLNLLLALCILRESLPSDRRRPFSLRMANTLAALRSLAGQSRSAIWYAAALTAWSVAQIALPVIFPFYAMTRFGWTPGHIGFALGGVGLGTAVVQGLLIRAVIAAVGEARATTLGVTSFIAASALYATGGSVTWVYAAIAVGVLSGLVLPSISGLLSRAVDPGRQGELQGAVAGLNALALVIGPPIYTYVFAAFTRTRAHAYVPGAPFLVAAGFALSAIAFLYVGRVAVQGARTIECAE